MVDVTAKRMWNKKHDNIQEKNQETLLTFQHILSKIGTAMLAFIMRLRRFVFEIVQPNSFCICHSS